MATSRGASPADPTLVATTNDASRGGLFARSNVANPVGGVDVNGVSINDNTITLNFTINGDTQTQDFTLNQATDETLTFDFTVAGTGGTTPGTDTFIERVVLSGTDLTFTYNASSGRMPETVSLSSIAGGHTEQTIRDWADEQIVAYHAANPFVRTVNGSTPDSSGNVVVTSSASVDASDFESTDSTVTFADNTTTGVVDVQARPAVIGNGGRNGFTSTENANTLTVASDVHVLDATGTRHRLVLVDNNGAISFSLETAQAPPTPTPRGVVTPPATTNVFDDTSPIEETIEVVDIMTIGTPSVTVTDPDGNMITPTVTTTPVSNDMSTVTITVDNNDAGDAGTYEIDTTIPTTDTDGNMMTVTEMSSFDRTIPFAQSRADMTTAAEITGATLSEEAFNPMTGLTAIAGGGTLYIAIDNATFNATADRAFATVLGFPITLRRLRSVSVTAGSDTINYNVFSAGINAGAMATNFRLTR